MFKKFLCLLCLAALLTGCGAPEPTVPSEPTAAPTQAPTLAPTEPTDPPQTETPIEVNRHPLTGQELEAALHTRPFAVSFNNTKAAMPMHGIGQADVVYEMLVEGTITRCLGVFTDIGAVEKLGSIRSARMYTVSLVRYLDAILVRAGGSSEADAAISSLGIDELDGIKGYADGTYYRDQDRRAAGYALEHTLFTGGPALLELAQSRQLTLRRDTPLDYGLTFVQDATPAGESAASVRLWFGSSTEKHKSTTLSYDPESGLYLASQFGQDWIDASSGQSLSFRNVLILCAKTWVQEDNIHKSIQLTGSGTGWFACGGKIVPICWSRAGEEENFLYTLTDGTPLALGIGRSYVGIVPTEAKVAWE